jgi:hypothetical protein
MGKDDRYRLPRKRSNLSLSHLYTIRKVSGFPGPSRDVSALAKLSLAENN